MNALQFVMSLQDRMSGPAAGITKSLKALETNLKSVTGRTLARFDKGITASATKIKQLGGVAMKAAGAAALTFGATAAAGLAVAAGAVGAFAFQHARAAEKSQGALRLVTGDVKAYSAAIAAAKGLSNLYGSDPREVEAQLTRLIGKGYDLATALKVIQGAGDLTAMGAEGAKLIEVFEDIAKKGKVEAGTLEQLGGAGINPEKLRKELLGGLASVTGDAAKDIEAALQNGTIKAADVQGAALRVITQTTGKALGGAAKDAGQTLDGLLAQLGTAPTRLFDAANTSGAIKPLQQALASLVSALNPETATGQKMVAAISKVANAVGKLLARISPEDVIAVVDAIGSGLELVGDVIDAVVPMVSEFVEEFSIGLRSILGPMKNFAGGGETLSKIMSALGVTLKVTGAVLGVTAGLLVQLSSWVIEAVVVIVEGLTAFIKFWWSIWLDYVPNTLWAIVSFFPKIVLKFIQFGIDLVAGIIEGIKGNWGKLKGTWNGLVDSLPKAVADKLKIASPSKVMMELGGYTVEGFTRGVNDNASGAQSALSAAVQTTTVTTNRGGHTYQITVSVQGSSADVAGDVEAAVRRVMRDELGAAALELGAA